LGEQTSAESRRGRDAARKAGDASGATDNYSRAIALYGSQTPAAAWTYHMRAFALEDLGRNDEALSDRNKALSLNPNFPGGYRWRGDLLAKLGRYDEALMDFNKALSGVPDSSITMTARAETLEKMGRSDEALVDYTKAIAAAHDRSKWIKRLEDTQKWLMKLIGKTQGLVPSLPTPDKIEELSRSLSDYQNQTIAYAYGQRGNFLRNANRFDEALSDYDHALEFAPDNRFIYVNRGWLYEKKGDIEKAHADYEKAASLAPPDEWLTQALERTG
jgi:tetratricopeptide (TPR) repeat protein